MSNQIPQMPKVKGMCDIAFCLDASESMADCFEGLKANIAEFARTVATAVPQRVLDVRLAFVSQSGSRKVQRFEYVPFTSAGSVGRQVLAWANFNDILARDTMHSRAQLPPTHSTRPSTTHAFHRPGPRSARGSSR